MNIFFKKIPMIIYAIGIIIISIYITHEFEIFLLSKKWILETDGEAKVGLYTGVLTIIAIFYAVLQLQTQRKDSLVANEYLNQPDFEFYDFTNQELLENHQSPGCCCVGQQKCTNNCNDEHWFNIKQIGNLPATDIKISLFHERETQNVLTTTRVKKIETLNKNGTYQYKLPPNSFSEDYLDRNLNGKFFALISYKSLYSNIKYKRIYELEYAPAENIIFLSGLWSDNISFFSVILIKIIDDNSISSWNLLKARWNFIVSLIMKQSLSMINWGKNI
jgi:hypothetical protein